MVALSRMTEAGRLTQGQGQAGLHTHSKDPILASGGARL